MQTYNNFSPLPNGTFTRQPSDDFQAYLLEVRPLFDELNRLIAQTAGLMLLGQGRHGFQAWYAFKTLPHEQAQVCWQQLHEFHASRVGLQHHRHLCETASIVCEVTRQMDVCVKRREQYAEYLQLWCMELEKAARMLRCGSNPMLGIATVDFFDGCAFCAPILPNKNKQGAHLS